MEYYTMAAYCPFNYCAEPVTLQPGEDTTVQDLNYSEPWGVTF
jgi:hypothetical protein